MRPLARRGLAIGVQVACLATAWTIVAIDGFRSDIGCWLCVAGTAILGGNLVVDAGGRFSPWRARRRRERQCWERVKAALEASRAEVLRELQTGLRRSRP